MKFEIRPLQEKEVERFIELQVAVSAESDNLMLELEEAASSDSVEKIKTILNDSNAALLVAEQNDMLVGFVVVRRDKRIRERHRCNLGLAVRKDFSGQGIGMALLSTAQEWAEKCGIQKLELTVRTDNAPAINLYKKLGFEIEGVRRKGIKIDGNFFDQYFMGKIL